MTVTLGIPEKVVLAAWRLHRDRPIFTAEELAVAAWKDFPDTFGLLGVLDETGTPKYPDSNRVFKEIMGSAPARKKGWFEKVGRKRYRLTAAGESVASGLKSESGEAHPRRAGMSRAVGDDLARYWKSRAMTKWRESREDDITFHDAASFWGISARSRANDLRSRLAHFNATLDTARVAGQGESFVLNYGGEVWDEAALAQLKSLSDFLEDRFVADLAVIRKRSDR